MEDTIYEGRGAFTGSQSRSKASVQGHIPGSPDIAEGTS
jgi:hypothetical protein